MRTSPERKAALIAVAAAAIALVGGVAYSFLLGPELRYYDEMDYLGLARRLVELGHYTQDGITPTASRPPGYPVFLAAGAALGAGVQALRIMNFVCLAASILLLYRLTGRIGGPRAGAIAAALALLYPVFFYAAGTLYPQTLASTLFLLALVIVDRTDHPPHVAHAAGAGLLFGVLILTVPTFVFSLVIVSLWLVLTHRSRALPACATGLAVVLLVLGSWQLRNYQKFGEFVFVSTNSGVNLLLGNSENTRSDSGVNVDIAHYREASSDLSEVERNRFFRDAALRWVAENPASAARLYVAKWLHYFSYRDELATESEATGARELLMLVTYGPLFALTLLRLGFWRRLPVRRDELLLIALFFLNSFFLALFFTRIRFRIPLDYLLIAEAGIFLSFVVRHTIERLDIS